MSPKKGPRTVWSTDMEEQLVELWQEHQCLFDISSELYHSRVEKEKSWREIADSLQQPVEEVKTRAISLRTQYSRLSKPKPRPTGSVDKPLTSRQKWILRVMDFMKQYIVHRPCETTDDTEDQEDLSESLEEWQTPLTTPDTPSDTTLHTASTLEWLDEGASPTAADESPSTASRKAPEESSPRGVKRKGKSESDIELQKLSVLKQMAAKVAEDTTPDAFSTFGNLVAAELRQIKDPANTAKLKRNIMNMIYDTQETERNVSSSSQAQLHALLTFIGSVRAASVDSK